ncbi:MAG: hypothetical protein COA69_11725 [Robiginitomaculum sp.]|nr:MAG: hypothetical protein COA69_11725 [Robiginitomaculum sp.]
MIKLTAFLFAGAAFLAPLSSLAAEEKKAAPAQGAHSEEVKASNTKAPDAKGDDGLLETQRRLNALILAAVNQKNNVQPDQPDVSHAQSGHEQTGHKKIMADHPMQNAHGQCVAEEIFEFPESVYVDDFSDLSILKNSIISELDQVDEHKVRLLVLAYLGLGFGEEAQLFSDYLDGPEKTVLNAMGRAVSGLVVAEDLKILAAQGQCYPEAILWSYFARVQFTEASDADADADDDGDNDDVPKSHSADTSEPDTSEHGAETEMGHGTEHGAETKEAGAQSHSTASIELSRKQLAQLQDLPYGLAAMMAKRLGISAVEHGSLGAASPLLEFLKDVQKKDEDAGPFDDEGKFFEAIYKLAEGDRHAYPVLKALAKRDGVMQVRALNILGAATFEDGHHAYPGYDEDLDGAAHVFSQHPEGKQALAQKIGFFVSTNNINQAIGMTKEKFAPDDAHYLESVVLVSEHMQVQLLGQDAEQKLQALNTLIREQIFFDVLADGFPLRQAGVSASLDLELAELAPQILPTDQWGRLDMHILRGLAQALPEDMKVHLPAKAFSGSEFEVAEIKSAFQDKRPGEAMAVLRTMPKDEAALKMTASQAWEAGYWGIAREAIADLNDVQSGSDTGLKIKENLASTLSVPSPHLTPVQASRNIGELKRLQTYLDNDIEIIKEYVNGG